MNKVKFAAHRGYMEKYPENTIRAYKEALKHDIDQVEIDLHMPSDGEIIMMHDHTVDRTTNGTGFIKDKTLKEIRELDAGIKKGEEFKGEKVPLFTEYLDLMQNYPDIETNVEIKEYPENNPRWQEAVDKIIALIEKYDISKKIYINTWSGEVAMYIAKKYNGKYRLHGYYPIWLNHGNYDKEELYKHLYCVCLFNCARDENGKTVWPSNSRVMDKEHFDYVKSLGLEAWVHFPAGKEEMIKAFEYGADAYTINDVELGLQILKDAGIRD